MLFNELFLFRSVDAFMTFIKEQIQDPIKVVESIPDLFSVEVILIRLN